MTETIDRSARREELRRQRLHGQAALSRSDGISQVPRGTALALSFAQRRLWILDRLRPGGTEYLMTRALRLRGALDMGALRTSLDGIVARHEVLRTRYEVVAGDPVQVIDAPRPVDLSELDIRHLDQAARESRLNALLTVERQPVDLATGPVFRATLVRLAADEHALLLTAHHIASDGWSEDVMLSELSAGYLAAVNGTPGPPPPPVQYVDFAMWQRQRLSGELLDKQLTYWRERLAGLDPLELPTDRPRPRIRDAAGDQVSFTVPVPIARTLTNLARDHGATPFMMLLAAYQVLLSRYSGQTDVAVGTPIAGRDRAEVQNVIGLFLNTLVLRTDLSGDPSFVEVLRRVREAALEAYTYQELPFEHLVDELAPERDPSRNPLFSTMFLWQEVGAADVTANGLSIEDIPLVEDTAKFDLTMAVAAQSDGSWGVGIGYSTSLFDRSTITRLTTHYVQLLAGIAAAPESPISQLKLLSLAERQRMLVEWNDTTTAYPTGTLPELFEAQVARTPDAVAVRFADEQLSYAELNARSNRLAHRLRAMGTGPESVVGVCLPRSTDLIVSLLAILKAGGAYLPLDPDHPPARQSYLLDDAAARVLITDRTVSGHRAQFLAISTDLSGESEDNPISEVAPEHPAYVIYTSGSTGRPKGVVIEHRGIVNRLRWMQDTYRLATTDRVLQKTPATFDVSVWEFFWPLTTGATLVLARPGGHRDPTYLAELINTEAITTLHFVPSMLRAFLVEPFDGLPSVHRIICSGEALAPDLVAGVHERIGCDVHNLYGPTEASVDVTATRCGPDEPVTIGRPIANTQTYIVDRDLQPVPVGVPGELMLGGVQLARGYLNRAELTAETFIPNPFGLRKGQRLYRTGDLARYRSDGSIDYLGRLDDQVKINGQRIELGEIETVLSEQPTVDSAVVAVHDEQLVGYLVPDTVDVEAVARYLRERLPEQLIPATWVRLDTLPLTTSGKADRRALPSPDRNRSTLAGEYVPPRTPLEHLIAETMADAIGIDRVGLHDRFFQLGGDSMRAIRVVGAMRASGLDVSVHDMFTHQTVAELATLVDQSLPAATTDTLVGRFEQVTPADRELLPTGLVDAYPMAQTQSGMIYEMLAADRPVYQNVVCYRLRDDASFSLAAMDAAVQLLVDRHEILRTSFDLSTYSENMQLVHQSAELSVGYDDLRELSEPEQRAVLDKFLGEERATLFDISRPPLLRYRVHQIDDCEWWLTHTECHAILDGWSHTSTIAELTSVYLALRHGRTPNVKPLPAARFADFVALEQKALNSAQDRDFWVAMIRGHEKLTLPDSWGGDEDPQAPSEIINVWYDDLEPGLRRLASAANASIKSVMHAAHLKVLSIISGKQHFFDGLVCNGRPELLRSDEVRGMYLNTVPFAADVTAATWRDLVKTVFDGEAELWPHRRYPMPAIQREWGNSSPLFDAAFAYLDFHVLKWESDEGGMVDDFSPGEMAFGALAFPGVLHVDGHPSRVNRTQLEMLARTYRHVLEAMAANPDGDTRDVALAPIDRDQVVLTWNDTANGLPTECLVHQLVERQALSTPEASAIRRGPETISYAALDRRANQLAHRLRAIGVGRETIVGLYLSRGPDLVVGLLAVLKAGGAFLPLDPDHPAERVQYMLTDAAVEVLLTTQQHRPGLPTQLPAKVATIDLDQHDDLPEDAPKVRLTEDNLAYVIYTSGSTGRPKGVAVPHRGPQNLFQALGEQLDLRPGDRVLQNASASFDGSVAEVLAALTTGAEVVLPPHSAEPGDLRQQSAVVTHMFLPPSILEGLSPTDFPELRVLVSVGESCSGEQIARWARNVTFINGYGPTETCIAATVARIPATSSTQPPSIGLPVANVRVYVLDADQRPLPLGVPGELCIGGAGLARGYVNRPDLTADRFVPDPYGPEPGSRLYRTGDVVSRNADGALRYHGRRDHQVKIRGFRIELSEIERTLSTHPGVAGTAVTAHRTESGDALVAYTVSSGVSRPTVAELRAYLRQRLPQYLLPAHYLAIDEFPITSTGKIDRSALPAPDSSRPELDTEYVAPQTVLQHAIAAAWTDALGVARIGIHDDFVDLGGHSLAMMRIIATLKARHGLDLTFRSFIEHSTIAALSAAIDGTEGLESARGAMMWLRRGGIRPPLVCVHPGGGSAHWFLRIVPYLDHDQPVIAFEWPGPHDDTAELPTAATMAERYHDELRQAQPHGPYRLFSWCGGSPIATELASRLVNAGEEVTFMLLDPSLNVDPDTEDLQELARMRRLEQLFDEIARDGAEAGTDARREEILELLQQLVNEADEENGVTLPEHGVGAWPRSVRIWREVMEMDLAYRPQTYPGRLHLIASDELAQGRHVVALGKSFEHYLGNWRGLVAGGVQVHRVPGDHIGIMRPPLVSRLAEVIKGLIAGAETERNPH